MFQRPINIEQRYTNLYQIVKYTQKMLFFETITKVFSIIVEIKKRKGNYTIQGSVKRKIQV